MPAVASEQSIFIKNHDYNNYIKEFSVFVPIFRGLDAYGGRKLRTDTHTHAHTRGNHSNDKKALKCKPSAEFGGNIGIFGLKTTFHAYMHVLGEHTSMKNEL